MFSHDCQSDEVLGRYAAGDLPEAEAETVNIHIASCSACLGRLDDLSRRPDPLVAALRQPHTPSPGRNLEFDRALSLLHDREARGPSIPARGNAHSNADPNPAVASSSKRGICASNDESSLRTK